RRQRLYRPARHHPAHRRWRTQRQYFHRCPGRHHAGAG
ncbi:nuclease, partial [Xanthomonas oryzae pv. oryzae]